MVPRRSARSNEQLLRLVRTLKEGGVPGRVTLDVLARENGIEVLEEDFPTIAGYARPFDGSWYIAINRKLPPEAREFTLAHEYAHAAHGIYDDRQAETFAAELLWEKRFAGLQNAIKSAAAQEGVPTGISNVAEAVFSLLTLVPNLADPRKKTMTEAFLGALGFTSLIALGAFGLISLARSGVSSAQGVRATSPGCL